MVGGGVPWKVKLWSIYKLALSFRMYAVHLSNSKRFPAECDNIAGRMKNLCSLEMHWVCTLVISR